MSGAQPGGRGDGLLESVPRSVFLAEPVVQQPELQLRPAEFGIEVGGLLQVRFGAGNSRGVLRLTFIGRQARRGLQGPSALRIGVPRFSLDRV